MAEWQKINLELTDIVSETEKAYLIPLPAEVAKNLDVKYGTSFWFPRKLVKGERGDLAASMPPDFTVNLFHSVRDPESGTYSKKGEEQIGASTLIEQWNAAGNAPGKVSYEDW